MTIFAAVLMLACLLRGHFADEVPPGTQAPSDTFRVQDRVVITNIELHSDIFVPPHGPSVDLAESFNGDFQSEILKLTSEYEQSENVEHGGLRLSSGDLCAPEGSYTSDPGDCSKYYWCVFGRLLSQSCPGGLHFNSVISTCDWPSNVQCNKVSTTRGGPMTSVTSTTKAPITTTIKPTTKATITTTIKPTTKAPITTTIKPTTKAPITTTIKPTTKAPITTTLKPTTKAPITTPRLITTVAPMTTISSTTFRPDGASCCNTSSSSNSSCDGEPNPCGSYKVVCYFTNWAMYRPGNGSYTPRDIDPSLCTHVVYAFATLHPSNYVIQVFDTWADTDPPNEHYRQVTALRSKGICVLLGLGGWGDSGGFKYSQLCNSPTRRALFIAHAVTFLQIYGFCGLDVDIEFPSCPQTLCSGPVDKKCFADFMCEIKAAFRTYGLQVTMAVSPSATISDQAYDIPRLSPCVDHVSIMSYDYHGHWEGRTGHVAPLFYSPGDEQTTFNANSSVTYWLDRGLPSCKMVLGVPMYGQSFRLADPTQNGLNARTVGGGAAGLFTRASGFLAFYEIYKNAQLGWTVRTDDQLRIGPYAFQGDQWVSFDDCRMVLVKMQYVRSMTLGGAMVWALDLDDFRNMCGCGNYPLLKTINRGLCRIAGEPANCCVIG